MSLDLTISQEIASYNITHNLTEMAEAIKIDWISLYDVLWRGDENGFATTENTKDFLLKAIQYMEEHKNELQKYNSDNWWGTYDWLLKFCKEVLSSCYVDWYISYSR